MNQQTPPSSRIQSSTRRRRLYRMIVPLSLAVIAFMEGASVPNIEAAESENSGARGFLLVANKGEQTLGIIDPVAGRQIAIVPEDGITGHEVVASPDGK